jgi:hypothetical protein
MPPAQWRKDVLLHSPVEHLQPLKDEGGAEVTADAAGVAMGDLRANLEGTRAPTAAAGVGS